MSIKLGGVLKITVFSIILLQTWILFTTPLSDHWIIQGFILSKETSTSHILFNPLQIPFPLEFYIFRPFTVLLFKFFYPLVSHNYIYFRLFQIAVFTLFIFSIFKFLFLIEKNKEKRVFTILLLIMSPPLILSLWMGNVEELIIAVLTIFIFIHFSGVKKTSTNQLILLIILFSFTAFLLKETSRVIIPLILFSFLFSKILLRKRVIINEIALFSFISFLALVISLPNFYTKLPAGYKMELTLEHIGFVLLHISNLLLFAFSPVAAWILFTYALFLYKKETKKYVSYISLILLTSLILGTPIAGVYPYGNALFSSSSKFYFLSSILLLVSLFMIFTKSKNIYEKTFSLSVFFFSIVTAILIGIFPFCREDISSRAFVITLPMFSYLVSNSSFLIYKYLKKNKWQVIFMISFLIYFSFSSFLIFNSEYSYLNNLYYEALNKLSHEIEENSVIFYTRIDWPVADYDIEFVSGKKVSEKIHSYYLSPVRKNNTVEILLEEICEKTAKERLDKWKKAYIVNIWKDYGKKDRNVSFHWLEEIDSLSMLKSAPLSFYWSKDIGLAELLERGKYTNLVEKFAKSHNLTLLFEKEIALYEPELYLENIITMNKPIRQPVIKAKVYALLLQNLECTNFYPEEEYKGIRYTWMANNATLKFYSNKDEEKTLKIKTWSFYEPKELMIFHNEKLIFQGTIYPDKILEVEIPINLTKGENKLTFFTPDDCTIPMLINNSSFDLRCLSIAISYTLTK